MSYTIGIDLGGSCVKAFVVTRRRDVSRHNLPLMRRRRWSGPTDSRTRPIHRAGAGRKPGKKHGLLGTGTGGGGRSCITHMPVRLKGWSA
ncbi:MAG: hypothetical protein CM1200mP34_4980 [Verrucomicrobiales bacterium]|nr:MAG: hypothetical protein CM1200mP34_4980 [Verrucomicrobiales bacterium]